MWKIWLHVPLFRYIFSVNQLETIFPIKNIQKYVSLDSLLAFSNGTIGVEQKISMLGVDKKTGIAFYIKYGTSDVARKNIVNEGLVLQQLKNLSFVPQIELTVNSDEGFSLIKTTVFIGNKIKNLNLDDKMIQILFDLSDQKIKTNKCLDTSLMSCFAHGDFCVWNMLKDHEDIELFDWEMGGEYPLGYDLFTYIFQYEFLINGSMRFEMVITENIGMIKKYFDRFQITDWIPYLLEFSKLKCDIETEKNNKDLKWHYLELKKFIENYRA